MEVINDIMFTCIILHNMILDDKKDVVGLEDFVGELQEGMEPFQRGLSFEEFQTSTMEIQNSDTHYSLRGDLIEHLWAKKGTNLA
jgi:hypothetical protein